MKTLTEMNAGESRKHDRGTFTVASRWAVGRNGKRRSGTKMHLILVSEVVASTNPMWPVGKVFSCVSACGGNHGQYGAAEVKGADTDAVNCEKCQH